MAAVVCGGMGGGLRRARRCRIVDFEGGEIWCVVYVSWVGSVCEQRSKRRVVEMWLRVNARCSIR
jgi:hypothetical protein